MPVKENSIFVWPFTEGEIWICFSVGICITQCQVIVIRFCFQQQLFIWTHETIRSVFHENILKSKDIFHKNEKLRLRPKGMKWNKSNRHEISYTSITYESSKFEQNEKRAYFFCKILAKYLQGKTFHLFLSDCLEDLSIVLIFYGDLFGATCYWTFGSRQNFVSHRFFMQETLLYTFPGLFMVSCTNNICDLNPTCILNEEVNCKFHHKL